MDFIVELGKFGVVGLMAGIFLWQYVQEKKEHATTRAALVQSLLDRLSDSKENSKEADATTREVAITIQQLTSKIESVRERQ